MQVRVLGCGGGVQQGIRTTALLVDDDLLLDAGSGIGELSSAEMVGIRRVYLSHSHLDHVAFLPFLLDRLIDQGIAEPVCVYGRAETLEALRAHIFNGVIWPDFTVLPTPENPVVELVPMAAGATHHMGDRMITMLESRHAVPAAGYCVDDGQLALAFSGDCTTNERLWAGLNAQPRLDHLIVEVALPNERETLARAAGHYTPARLATDLALLEHDPTIWITHLTPGHEEQILAQCRAAIPNRAIQLLADHTRIP